MTSRLHEVRVEHLFILPHFAKKERAELLLSALGGGSG
jgi:hypothetical protein